MDFGKKAGLTDGDSQLESTRKRFTVHIGPGLELEVKIDPEIAPGVALVIPPRRPGETLGELADRTMAITGLEEVKR